MSSTPPNFDSLRKSFIPPSNEEKTKKKTIKIQNEKEPNIMEQMVSYNKNITNTLIEQLNKEYLEQIEINKILKEKDYDESVKEIEEFVENNKENIEEQVLNLENVYILLKKVLKENNELQEDKDEYKELLEEEEVKKIAGNMKKLKSLKNSVMLFLQENGIHTNV